MKIYSITLFEKMPILQALTESQLQKPFTGHMHWTYAIEIIRILTGHYCFNITKKDIYYRISNAYHETLKKSYK